MWRVWVQTWLVPSNLLIHLALSVRKESSHLLVSQKRRGTNGSQAFRCSLSSGKSFKTSKNPLWGQDRVRVWIPRLINRWMWNQHWSYNEIFKGVTLWGRIMRLIIIGSQVISLCSLKSKKYITDKLKLEKIFRGGFSKFMMITLMKRQIVVLNKSMKCTSKG